MYFAHYYYYYYHHVFTDNTNRERPKQLIKFVANSIANVPSYIIIVGRYIKAYRQYKIYVK